MSRRVVLANPRKGVDIDNIALNIIRRFQPEILDQPAPFDIERFFDCELERITGVEPDYRELPPGIYGYTDSDEMVSVMSIDLMEDHSQKYFCRSTMAHETSHSVIHVPEFRLKKAMLRSIHDKQHVSLRMYRAENVPVYKNPEWQAWRLAGALLMPEATIRPFFQEGLGIQEMSDIFEVNPAFVRSRLKALKLVS